MKIGWLGGMVALGAAGALRAEAPAPGTISIAAEASAAELKPAVPVFVDAVGQAFATRGFTVLEGEGHAGLVADILLTRTDVGSGRAKVASDKASARPGGASGVGASIAVPLPTNKMREVPLQQTRLEIRIARRGDSAVLWHGAATTVRPAETRTGSNSAVAVDLAQALLANYPAQSDEAVSIP